MKSLLHIVIVLFISIQLQAQQKTITGTVSSASDGLPIPGVSVIIKGTTIGTQTNFDGKYAISAKVGDELQFSFVGFVTQTLIVEESEILNVVLKADTNTLDEIVVVGYGTTTKRVSTGSAVTETMSGVRIRGASSKISKPKNSTSLVFSNPQSGQLTAGEINDLDKWDGWLKALNSDDSNKIQENWQFHLRNKVDVNVSNTNNLPLNNIVVSLYDENNILIMKGLTDVYGNISLYKDLDKECQSEYYTLQVLHEDNVLGKKIKNNDFEVKFLLEYEKVSSHNIDLMFTIDATGSMGDEINYLKSELQNIIERLDKTINQKRVALTFYRDHGDEYVVKDMDFNTNIEEVKTFLSHQSASGGGDYEEAVEEALKISMSKSWQLNAKSKLLFLLLDAPTHYNQENVEIIKNQIKIAQERGIKIIPIVASGANKNVEFLMRYFSVATNGTYVFLTDDSGIGNPHIKPTTDNFKVEKLNDLIVRLIEKYSGVNS